MSLVQPTDRPYCPPVTNDFTMFILLNRKSHEICFKADMSRVTNGRRVTRWGDWCCVAVFIVEFFWSLRSRYRLIKRPLRYVGQNLLIGKRVDFSRRNRLRSAQTNSTERTRKKAMWCKSFRELYNVFMSL